MSSATAQRLLAQHALEDDPSVLNLSYALAAEGAFDHEAFGWALARMCEAYPALGAPLADSADLTTFIDLSDRAPGERGGLVGALIALERRTPFDVGSPPLVRAIMVRLSAQRHVVLMTFHHAVADSWILSEYASFISRAYAAVTAGEQLPAPAAARSSARRPTEQRLLAERTALAANLVGLTRAQCDPFPPGAPGALMSWSIALQAPEVAALQATAVGRRVTRFALLSAAVADALCDLYQLDALLVGTTVLNRHSSGDLASGEARYQGAIFKIPRGAMRSLRETASAAAAAAERMMPYEEQLACAREVAGESDVAPAVFVMIDRHPLATLNLRGVKLRVVVPDGELTRVPRPAHSPRCGRIAFFWRDSPAGATLSIFAEERLVMEADQLLGAVCTRLVQCAGISGFVAVPATAWDEGLASVPIPVVDALSPVILAERARAEERVA